MDTAAYHRFELSFSRIGRRSDEMRQTSPLAYGGVSITRFLSLDGILRASG